MIPIDDIISHRFRGFGPEENTIESLLGALNWGVTTLEFDVRIAKCGTPMVYHDEHAPARDGQRKLCDIMASDYAAIGGRFPTMPTLDSLLRVCARHSNAATLLIDIKDSGFEDAIRSLVRAHDLQGRVVYVSWLPEVLYALYELEPEATLCFSHWAAEPGLAARANHHVHVSKDGHIPRGTHTTLGERSGWWLQTPLQGELREILSTNNGYICVPRPHLDHENTVYYAHHSIGTTAFSYVNYDKALTDYTSLDLALVFSDSKQLFEDARAQSS
jgi:glycerophosphoryl diester phosphodiesterase